MFTYCSHYSFLTYCIEFFGHSKTEKVLDDRHKQFHVLRIKQLVADIQVYLSNDKEIGR